MAAGRFDLHLDTAVTRVERNGSGSITVHLLHEGTASTLEVDEILVATGRIPNSDQLAVQRTGVQLDPAGRIVLHADMQTAVAGIYAPGDIPNRSHLKHAANPQART